MVVLMVDKLVNKKELVLVYMLADSMAYLLVYWRAELLVVLVVV